MAAGSEPRQQLEQILAPYMPQPTRKRAPIDIGAGRGRDARAAARLASRRHRLEASIPKLPLVVIGDATQLHQVVMNLCSNAIQATSAGGTLRVALEARSSPPNERSPTARFGRAITCA